MPATPVHSLLIDIKVVPLLKLVPILDAVETWKLVVVLAGQVHLKAVREVAANLEHDPVFQSWQADATWLASREFNVHFVYKKELEIYLICSQIDHRHAINSLYAQLLVVDLKYFECAFHSEQVSAF